MPLYFMLHDAARFHGVIHTALAAIWRQHSFAPCESLRAVLVDDIARFAQRYHVGNDPPPLARIDAGTAFDRAVWRALVGEVLLYGAVDVPEFQTAPETLSCLLAPGRYSEGPAPRERLAPVEQAHFGSRDLVFGGGWYRPDHAGWNDRDDVARLAGYLASIQPAVWTAANLAGLRDFDPADHAEELEYACEWFEPLRAMYHGAAASDQIVVCELL
jgi:hypothetical protein